MEISVKNSVIAALAVAGAVVGVSAHAQNVTITSPTAGPSSQLVFWVTNTTNNTTFADVLTHTVGSMFTPPGTGLAGVVNTYNGDSNFSLAIGGDSNLVSFLNTAGGSFTWGITAGSSLGTGPGSNIMMVTGSGPTADAASTSILKSSLPGAIGGAGWAGDVLNLQTSPLDGSGFNATLQGVIGTPTSKSLTGIDYYGAYANQAGLLLTQSSTLYAITQQAGQSNGTSFNIGSVKLTGSGATLDLVFTGNGGTTPVPLPAAVWLLGSGLLGLAGVGRRRAVKTEAA
jgi:hypothetical protein